MDLRTAAFAAVVVAAGAAVAVFAGPPPPGTFALPPPKEPIRLQPSAMMFKPSPTLPAGTEMAVLEGDPKGPGIFTIRLRLPAGFHLRTHTHPVDERVTVLEGSVAVAIGHGMPRRDALVLPAGAFYLTPPGLPHDVWSDDGALIQITGNGPWRVDFPSNGPPRIPG